MTNSMRTIGSFAVALALAVPASAWGQAVARNSGSATTSSSSGSGGGSSSGGGNAGGGSTEGTRVSPPSQSGGAEFREPTRIPQSTRSAPTRIASGEGTRVAPPPGGVASVSGSAIETSGISGAAVSRTAFTGGSASGLEATTGARVRGAGGTEGSRGSAVARPLPVIPTGDYVSFPFYGPWGGWYPWCYSGWGMGFMYYDPWLYGPTSWYWGRYGMWYDPSAYFADPYVTTGYSGGGSSGYSGSSKSVASGSLRIKANVGSAQVFLDGALAGTVDEFDGLKDHLDVDAGKHTVELRAEGYATATADIVVSSGKTRTLRLELKKVTKEPK